MARFCLKIFKNVIKSNFILYFIALIILMYLGDLNGIIRKSRVNVLNRLKPESLKVWSEYIKDNNNYDKKLLTDYLFYYENITKIYKNMPDAFGMLGFCYYNTGKKKQAVDAYKKAVNLNPHFFWYHYNLGIIYLKQGDYENAVKCFKSALETKIEVSLLFIKSSYKIYLPIIFELYKNREVLPLAFFQLKAGYNNCEKLLFLTDTFLSEPSNINKEMFKNINLAIF